ncbi:MAG: TonB-dependent receptor [Gemmatimonadota bacterium]
MSTSRILTLAIIAPGLLAAPANAAAQERPDTFRLEQLVVTATRSPMSRAAIPASVTVIDRAQLEARGNHFLDDALRNAAGISIARTGSRGGVASIFMRGGEPDYVQVLVDGVQINDPGGTISVGNITTADIERIEIVRGPASVLYGSDAVAGVINIITRSGGDGARIDAQVSGGRGERVGDQADGSYDTVDWSAGMTGSLRSIRYGATASGSRSDGAYAFNNEYENRTFGGKLQYAGLRADASLSGRWVDRTFHYPTTGAGAVMDTNKFSDGALRTIGLDAGFHLGDRAELRGAFGAHRADDGEEDPRDDPADDLSVFRSTVERRSADLRLNVQLPRGAVVTLGAEREWQEGLSTLHSESSFGPFDSRSDDTRDNTGWYAQALVTPSTHTTVTAGARVDENDRFGTFETFRAGIAQHFGALRLHGVFGTGFKEPTFYENFSTGFVRGDPSLQPEESRSLEAGIELARGSLRAGMTAFDQRFRNLIQYTGSPPSAEAPNYYNIGEAVSRGVEISASAPLTGRLAVSAAYTFLRTEVTDAGFGEDPLFQAGQRLIRRPAHQANATLDAQFGARTRAGITAHYVGGRDDLDFTDPEQWQGIRVAQPAYGTIDLSLERGLATGASVATVFGRVENALDERYQPVFNFPAPGRLLIVGLRATLAR